MKIIEEPVISPKKVKIPKVKVVKPKDKEIFNLKTMFKTDD